MAKNINDFDDYLLTQDKLDKVSPMIIDHQERMLMYNRNPYDYNSTYMNIKMTPDQAESELQKVQNKRADLLTRIECSKQQSFGLESIAA